MSRLIERAEVRTMLAEGQDVITWFELHRSGADPVPVANWARIEAGKVRRVRVAFDPRPGCSVKPRVPRGARNTPIVR